MKPKLLHFSEYLEQIARVHSRFNTFDDFLTIIVCCLSFGREEKEYFRVIKKYDKDEIDLFCRAFASLVMDMEQKPLSDCLGGYFEEYISNGNAGQFFTPEQVCDLMTEFVQGNKKRDNKLNDPCCGSGRMFLSYAKKDRNMYFVGADISDTCCKMTLINMCLNSLNGEVYHMDTLKQEVWRKWLVIVDPTTKIPCIYEVKEKREQTPQAAVRAERSIQQEEKKPISENGFLIFSPTN